MGSFDVLKRLAVGLLAAFLTAVLSPASGASAARPALAPVCYDAHQDAAVLADASSERGPPEANDHPIVHDAAGRWSRGAPARNGRVVHQLTYAYTAPGLLAQVVRIGVVPHVRRSPPG